MRGTSLDRLTLLATHALASALAGFALTQYAGIDIAVAALSGVVVFLCIRYVHDTIELARDKREMIEDLNTIHDATLSLRGAHDDTKKKVIEITTALARRVEAHEKKVAGELKFLERLLTDFPVQPASEAPVEIKTQVWLPPLRPATRARLAIPRCSSSSAARSKRTVSISISSPSSACLSARCASTKR